MVKRALKILVGVAVGGVCIWLVASRIDTAQLVATLVNVNLWLLALAVICLLGAQLLRGWVWVALSRPTIQLPLGKALRLVLVGNLANLVIPLRGGEFARVWLLGVRGGVGSGRAATVIMIERTMDMLLLFCLVIVGAMILGLSDWMGSGMMNLAAGGAIAIVGLMLLYAFRHRLKDLAPRFEAIPKLGKPASKLLVQFCEGLEHLRAKSTLAASAALIVSWAIVIVGLELRLAAFDIDVPLGGSIAVLAAGNLALSVPVVPAGIGVYEYTTVLCLERLGVAAAAGLAFAAASHALSIAVLAVAGAIALAFDQADMRRDTSAHKASEDG